MARKFRDLSEREILALAISLEEEDARVYADYADGLRDSYPDTAKIFDEMRAEEIEHRNSLQESFRRTYPAHPPPGRERLHPASSPLAVTAVED
jgi:rubrerythrin